MNFRLFWRTFGTSSAPAIRFHFRLIRNLIAIAKFVASRNELESMTTCSNWKRLIVVSIARTNESHFFACMKSTWMWTSHYISDAIFIRIRLANVCVCAFFVYVENAMTQRYAFFYSYDLSFQLSMTEHKSTHTHTHKHKRSSCNQLQKNLYRRSCNRIHTSDRKI